MSKVSFEGIGEMAATFYAEEGVKAGQVVKVSGDSTVAPCATGDRFWGVAVNASGGCAGVQVKGFARVSCADSTVTVGYVKLAADGNGGVKKATAGDEYMVIADDGAGSITIAL